MKTASNSVEVLLATYNNEKFVGELLASLARQTMADFRLIVSDDASSDGTRQILDEYRPVFGGRMTVYERPERSWSAKANFSWLMTRSTADYVLFADADDVWDDDKVAVTVAALQEVENRTGTDTPVMVFSDARLIDGEGQQTGPSYWGYKKIKPQIADHLSQVLVCPPMLGCASGCNRALMAKATPVPFDEVTGHDWWLLLVAVAFGVAQPLRRATFSYRLHGANSSNQQQVNLGSYARSTGKVERVRRGMMLRRKQAQALITVFGNGLPADARRTIERFVATGEQGPVRRRLSLLRGRYFYADLPRNAAMLLAM